MANKSTQGAGAVTKKFKKEIAVEGFFSFFDNTKAPDLELDEEEIDQAQLQAHTWHYDMGQFIAFTTIPKAIEFYLGLNELDNEDDFNHYEDESNEGEDEDEDDEGLDDSDDSE